MEPISDQPFESVVIPSLFETNSPSYYDHRYASDMSSNTEDFYMEDFSNYSSNIPSMGANPSRHPQSNYTEQSPEGSEVSGSTLSTSLGQITETQSIYDPVPAIAFDFPLVDTGIDMPRNYSNEYSWQFAQPEALSAFGGQDWNSAMIPDIKINEPSFRQDFFSEPESYETSMDLENQKCLKKTRNLLQTVSCKYPACKISFSKKADMDRHFGLKHEEAGFICGDCENEGTKSPIKRKDHFAPHLKIHLKKYRSCVDSSWEDFKKCPWLTCQPVNQKQSRLFSNQRSLEQHLLLQHQGKIPESSGKSEALSSSQVVRDTPMAGNKRACHHEDQEAKRPRQGDSATSAQTMSNPRWQGKEPSIMVSCSDHNHENGDGIRTIGEKENIVPGVSLVDFLMLLKLSGDRLKSLKTLLSTTPVNGMKKEMPVISFNTTQKSIMLRGNPNLINLCKEFLIVNLQEMRSFRGLTILDNASTKKRLGANDRLRSDFRSPLAPRGSSRSLNKIFAVRKGRDDSLLRLWMKNILPSLFKILDESIGRDYSASLIREGTSEESAIAVVRIESPQLPAKSTRGYILEELDKSCGFILADIQIAVEFSTGSLELLAGHRIPQVKDDKRELPFHTRYWKYPGMGASIGLLCTEEEFATLGCYVEADKQKYILTVDHVIEKSYRKLRSGIQDKRVLTSPAMAKVRKMKEELGYLRSSVEGEMYAEVRKQFGDRDVLPEDLNPLPAELSEVCRKHSFISEFVEELDKDEKDFKIGSLAYECEPNSTAPLSSEHSDLAADLNAISELNEENCLRMDWALFTADERVGANRHRYRYNKHDGTTDYFPQDEEHGEGDICQDTCIVESNEKVYFVGQTNGRLAGEITGALRGVVCNGRKSLEHYIIISPEQKKTGKEYGGDSGAAVLRASDDKLVGIVWGSINDEPIFTPIRTIFANIKRTLKANNVCLPRVQEDPVPPAPVGPAAANQVLLISGTESEVEPQRPFKSSDIVLPELTKEAAEKQSQLLSAKILTMRMIGLINIPNIGNSTALPITPTEGPSSPTPSLSSSCSSSPKSILGSPSPSDIDLTATVSDSADPLIVNQEEIDASSHARHSRDGYTIEGSYFDRYYKKLDLNHRLSIPYLLNNGSQSQTKRKSYPQVLYPRSPRHSSTWPFKTCDPWDSLVGVRALG